MDIETVNIDEENQNYQVVLVDGTKCNVPMDSSNRHYAIVLEFLEN